MGRTYSFPPLERERNEPRAKDISALGGFRRQQQRWRRVRRTPRRARTGTRRTPMEGPAGAARRPGYGTVIHKSMTAWPGDLTAWPPAGRLQDRHVRSDSRSGAGPPSSSCAIQPVRWPGTTRCCEMMRPLSFSSHLRHRRLIPTRHGGAAPAHPMKICFPTPTAPPLLLCVAHCFVGRQPRQYVGRQTSLPWPSFLPSVRPPRRK